MCDVMGMLVRDGDLKWMDGVRWRRRPKSSANRQLSQRQQAADERWKVDGGGDGPSQAPIGR